MTHKVAMYHERRVPQPCSLAADPPLGSQGKRLASRPKSPLRSPARPDNWNEWGGEVLVHPWTPSPCIKASPMPFWLAGKATNRSQEVSCFDAFAACGKPRQEKKEEWMSISLIFWKPRHTRLCIYCTFFQTCASNLHVRTKYPVHHPRNLCCKDPTSHGPCPCAKARRHAADQKSGA